MWEAQSGTKSASLFLRVNAPHGPLGSASAIGHIIYKHALAAGVSAPYLGSHVFRHTFAVHRLTRWYRQGVDLQERLPWLSAYMGHQDILGTEVYLHATPELLQLAAHRFAARARRAGVRR